MSEDENGLLVEGRLLDTQLGLDTYKTMKAGAIGGLSIGFRATEFAMQMNPDDARRTLKAVELFEVSVVGFPANSLARVSSVKAAEDIKTLRDFETFLRDAGGFSNARAKAIASHGFKAFDAGRDDGEGLGDELAAKSADHLLSILKGL
jgi:hypothetical protein